MLPGACMAQNHPAVSRAAPGSCRAWDTQQHSPHRGSCQQCHPIANAPKAASPPHPKAGCHLLGCFLSWKGSTRCVMAGTHLMGSS